MKLFLQKKFRIKFNNELDGIDISWYDLEGIQKNEKW